MRVTILGCGTSGGVPRIGNHWGDCDPSEPRNRRRRASIHVAWRGLSLLVDTSPDLREQCLGADIRHVDAVLYTHDHADHTHGIDDLRPLYWSSRERIPAYADGATFADLGMRAFGFAPLRLPDELDFTALFHGVDERVPVDALEFGARVLDRFLGKL